MKSSVFGLAVLILASCIDCQDPGSTPFPSATSSFSCHGRPPGYYADLETGCKTYHVCDGISHFTYICPRRTLFQQRSRICDHAYLVQCGDSSQFFEAEDRYPYDDEEVLLRLEESEESLVTGKENLKEDYTETEDEIISTDPLDSTETTETETETETATAMSSLPTTALSTKPPTPSTSTATEITKKLSTESPTGNSEPNSPRKFVKFRLKDFRSLFFIPELENNSIIAKPEKELVLSIEKSDMMTFRNRKEGFEPTSCPSHCNPKFLLPGTCHPCIMIK